MKRILLAIASVGLAGSVIASAAFADPIEDREAYMKQNGRLLGGVFAYVKGDKPFEAGEVMAALEAFNAHAQELDADRYWPEGSQGGDSSPKVWEDRARFVAEIEKFKTVAAAAVQAAPQDAAALGAAVGPIGGSCESCHTGFRVKKD